MQFVSQIRKTHLELKTREIHNFQDMSSFSELLAFDPKTEKLDFDLRAAAKEFFQQENSIDLDQALVKTEVALISLWMTYQSFSLN